jgi:hypothetical protein
MREGRRMLRNREECKDWRENESFLLDISLLGLRT